MEPREHTHDRTLLEMSRHAGLGSVLFFLRSEFVQGEHDITSALPYCLMVHTCCGTPSSMLMEPDEEIVLILEFCEQSPLTLRLDDASHLAFMCSRDYAEHYYYLVEQGYFILTSKCLVSFSPISRV